MGEFTDAEKAAFRQEVERKKLEGRKIDPTMTCPSCKCQMKESMARQLGVTCCPSCGSKQVEISTLAYDPSVRDNPLPSAQEAEQQSRSQRPWVR